MTGSFGARLRDLREARGIGLREFARRIGKSPTYVTQIEKDRRWRGKLPPGDDLAVMAHELGMSVDDMVGWGANGEERATVPTVDEEYEAALKWWRGDPEMAPLLPELLALADPLRREAIVRVYRSHLRTGRAALNAGLAGFEGVGRK